MCLDNSSMYAFSLPKECIFNWDKSHLKIDKIIVLEQSSRILQCNPQNQVLLPLIHASVYQIWQCGQADLFHIIFLDTLIPFCRHLVTILLYLTYNIFSKLGKVFVADILILAPL
jgi:hypothetical protein